MLPWWPWRDSLRSALHTHPSVSFYVINSVIWGTWGVLSHTSTYCQHLIISSSRLFVPGLFCVQMIKDRGRTIGESQKVPQVTGHSSPGRGERWRGAHTVDTPHAQPEGGFCGFCLFCAIKRLASSWGESSIKNATGIQLLANFFSTMALSPPRSLGSLPSRTFRTCQWVLHNKTHHRINSSPVGKNECQLSRGCFYLYICCSMRQNPNCRVTDVTPSLFNCSGASHCDVSTFWGF